VLLPPELDEPKLRQGIFFDESVDAEWEIKRPVGAARMHRWLLEEKFRRAVLGLDFLLSGGTVLVVCGGSGMDAQFLEEAGARVINSDLSLGAVRRAHERAQRAGLGFLSIVADAEHLPFADRCFDLVYVHDGLHHLDRPAAALAEVARVAATAVSVSEPARAAVTRLAVRFGLAQDREEAGNQVVRLTPDEIAEELTARGFEPAHMQRYGMYYRHEPGRAVRLFSKPALFPLAKGAFRLANRLAGRFGNKLVVQALRQDPELAR
jgi:ubiquinone/menaquinone biosynthesis C-methylase UbiE